MRAFLLAAGLLGTMALTACGPESPEQHPDEAPLPAGTALPVRDTVLPTVVEATGTAEPIQQATLSTRMMATVEAVLVHEGDRIEAGQVLVRLDRRDLDARAVQVEAGLAAALAVEREAEAMARRIRALYQDSAATRVQLEQVETGLARAQAGVGTARAAGEELAAMRSYTEIRSPFAGTVVQRLVDPGALAALGAPLLTVEDASRLRLQVTAAPELTGGLERGGEVAVTIAGRPYRGQVEGVVRGQTGNLARINVLVANPGREVPSGSAAAVLLPQGERVAPVIPASALVRQGDLVGVDLLVDGRAERRWIRVGLPVDGGLVEVLSGLRAGDEILVPVAAPGGR